MTTTPFNAKDIVSILKTCADAGVSEIEVGGMVARFAVLGPTHNSGTDTPYLMEEVTNATDGEGVSQFEHIDDNGFQGMKLDNEIDDLLVNNPELWEEAEIKAVHGRKEE